MKKLAIVIPAYKIDFFDITMQSLVNQTCKDFTVYIGEDCSPSDFMSIISKYEKELDIVYHRFNENFGGKDLVGHWTRCIELTQGEPWIWLFSDDDVVGERCVELFYEEISNGVIFDIYHFDVKIINSEGHVIYQPGAYPRVIDSETLYKESAKDNIRSFVVENVFSRNIYEKVGGFESFPMAWGSDMATWLKMGKDKGLKTICGDYVFWRKSNKNITPSKERDIIKRKFSIQVDFYEWVNNFFGTNSIRKFNKYVFFRYCVHYSNLIMIDDMKEVVNYGITKGIITPFQKYTTLILLPALRIAQSIKELIVRK